jgi:hypothetical protein
LQRWTIRGVDPDAVYAIRKIRAESGASLGAILSATILRGQAAARRKFTASSGVNRQLRAILRQIRVLLKRLMRIVAALIGGRPHA